MAIFETTAERGVVTDRSQALVGGLGQDLIGRVEEIGVGALATSTDAPAQLVQLSETEAFRAVHYQRIDRGQVDARLDDRRAHEHVEANPARSRPSPVRACPRPSVRARRAMRASGTSCPSRRAT